jgi:hypothetical protein
MTGFGMTACGMTNDKCPMTKEIPMPNVQLAPLNLRQVSARARLGRCNVRTTAVPDYSSAIVCSGVAAGERPRSKTLARGSNAFEAPTFLSAYGRARTFGRTGMSALLHIGFWILDILWSLVIEHWSFSPARS